MVSRLCRRRRTCGDGGFEAWCEMRVQERAKWRERGLLKVLDQQIRVGEARTGASYDGGEVATGQSSGRGGATWSAREKARGEGLGRRPAWRRRVGACRAGGGAGRAAATVRGDGLRQQRRGRGRRRGGGARG
jgi:hypothetical protein